jgi:hypothetical protein
MCIAFLSTLNRITCLVLLESCAPLAMPYYLAASIVPVSRTPYAPAMTSSCALPFRVPFPCPLNPVYHTETRDAPPLPRHFASLVLHFFRFSSESSTISVPIHSLSLRLCACTAPRNAMSRTSRCAAPSTAGSVSLAPDPAAAPPQATSRSRRLSAPSAMGSWTRWPPTRPSPGRCCCRHSSATRRAGKGWEDGEMEGRGTRPACVTESACWLTIARWLYRELSVRLTELLLVGPLPLAGSLLEAVHF